MGQDTFDARSGPIRYNATLARQPGPRSWAAPATAPAMRRADPASLQTLSGRSMGTSWSVRLANPGFAPLAPARVAIVEALDQVVGQMSPWESNSNLCRFNNAPAGSWHMLPPAFHEVLACSLRWAEASRGALDPTVGPLVELWGFGPRAETDAARARLPGAAALAQALGRTGFGRVTLDELRKRALQPGGVALDFCGIAKGYAVDLIAGKLAAMGFAGALVEVGGELRAFGRRPDGQPWRVSIAPGIEGVSGLALALHDQAVATSGDQWNAFELSGRRYSHTIDPRTGEPICHTLASVTVVHTECMHADALATVLLVLGPHEGPAFAKQHGVLALFCERSGEGPLLRATPGFPLAR